MSWCQNDTGGRLKGNRNPRCSTAKRAPALGKTPIEIYATIVRVHEHQALSMKCVYECFARFRKGRKSVSDKTRCGRPATSVSDENIEKVRKLITKDCQSTVRMIADELQINRESVRQIVT
ncbi:uncharacterized protein TNCV_799771 [Trichonephila clavipes]|nr:uncharacterized protein TNCV_799771 [Trichonephila clavipes]